MTKNTVKYKYKKNRNYFILDADKKSKMMSLIQNKNKTEIDKRTNTTASIK